MRERAKDRRQPLAGSLLLAHPRLRDPNFRRAVVFMTAHSEDGALGVVLNRPLNKKLGELGGDFALGQLAEVPVFQGGPVEANRLILAVWQVQPAGFQLHFGIDAEKAALLLVGANAHPRAFFGYSGWSSGQLENELERRTWVVSETPSDLLTRPSDANLWRSVLAGRGPEWRLMAGEPEEAGEN